MTARCQHHWLLWDHAGERCAEPPVPDRQFCAGHLSEALQRVEMVRNDAPRAWPGVVRGSAIGPGRRWRTVQG